MIAKRNSYLKNFSKITKIIMFIIFSHLQSQEIPNEFFEFKIKKLLYDSGYNWKDVSTFGPNRYSYAKESSKDIDSSITRLRIGINGYLGSKNSGLSFYPSALFKFKKYFYLYLYPRIVTNKNIFDRYTGLLRYYSRTGETDLSGVGFENDWLILQLGRGRQSWGAGNNIQIAISENSPSYDYGLAQIKFQNIKFRYFHGFLEHKNDYSRYITGRGIEWTNEKSMIVSLSEVVIYSGLNRAIDFAYFNPVSSHLEIEMNERQNQPSGKNANGVWQFSLDLKTKNSFRMSCNLLIDEYTIDKKHELEKGEGDAIAFSSRIVWTPKILEKYYSSIFSEYIMVGTHTFRHQNGSNNFVQRDYPLGWIHGSDGDQSRIGIQFFNAKNFIFEASLGYRRLGSESIIVDQYDPYPHFYAVPFPSGSVKNSTFFASQISWWYMSNCSLTSSFEWSMQSKNEESYKFILGVDYYFPISINLKSGQ